MLTAHLRQPPTNKDTCHPIAQLDSMNGDRDRAELDNDKTKKGKGDEKTNN